MPLANQGRPGLGRVKNPQAMSRFFPPAGGRPTILGHFPFVIVNGKMGIPMEHDPSPSDGRRRS
jgi:hypothetical protein